MKRLVVCCDGTWQSLGRDRLTNVALTARAAAPRDADGNAQIVHYSAGIGVELDRLSLFKAAFGAGLDQHLAEAYQFLNLNYEPGDEIYLFGFSRGAYTVRSLAGLIRKCGVLKRRCAHETRRALELYRARDIAVDAREAREFRLANAAAAPKLAPKKMRALADADASSVYDLRIRYIGVWDTVGALGVPRAIPFARGFNRKYEFHDLELSRSVLGARHAVALDERRNAFRPTLWSNLDALNGEADPPRFEQRWFPGDHSAVGGGAKNRGLSNAALLWVLEGAQKAGLLLDSGRGSVLAEAEAEIDPIRSPLREKGFALSPLALAGFGPRRGPRALGEVHLGARLRWAARRDYRPGALKRVRRALKQWAQRPDRAQLG